MDELMDKMVETWEHVEDAIKHGHTTVEGIAEDCKQWYGDDPYFVVIVIGFMWVKGKAILVDVGVKDSPVWTVQRA